MEIKEELVYNMCMSMKIGPITSDLLEFMPEVAVAEPIVEEVLTPEEPQNQGFVKTSSLPVRVMVRSRKFEQ